MVRTKLIRQLAMATSAMSLGAWPTLAQNAPNPAVEPGAAATASSQPREEGGTVGSAGTSNGTPTTGNVGEIVVTGTFIRSNSFKPSSPVDILSAADLATKAPTALRDQLATLPYNQSPQGSAPGNAAGSGTVGNLNLRGLGPQSTLVLLNGQRVAPYAQTDNYTDINTLVPEIMIRGIEVLKDGASALYGSDAVAGVVNVLTKNNAEGLELSAQRTLKTEGGEGYNRFGAVFGTDVGSSSHIVFGVQYDRQELITYDHIPVFEDAVNNTGAIPGLFATPGNPGVYSYVRRNAAGQSSGATVRLLDPLCGTVPQSAVTGAGTAQSCSYYFAKDQSLIAQERKIQIFTHAEHKFDNGIMISVEGGYDNSRVANTTTASGPLGVSLTVPYTNPGIPSALLVPAVNASGQLLYAVRNPSNPAQPLRDANNRVVLTSTPTVAASGVPFYEDLTFSGRVLGSQCGLPTQGQATVSCGRLRRSQIQRDVFHGAGTISGELGKFTLRNTVNYSEYRETPSTPGETAIYELQNALRGLGGASCNALTGTPGQGSCSYFNPFGSAIYASSGSASANTQAIIDYVTPLITDRYRTTLISSEGLISGDVLQLPAGPVGVAVGYQIRRDTWTANYDSHRLTGDIGAGQPSVSAAADRTTKAIFAELAIPVFDSGLGKLNVNAAVRHEWAGGALKTTDPKVGAIFTTQNNILSLRGSYGTSFLAPTLLNMYATTVASNNVQDPLYPTGLPRPTLITRGNPDLKPQKSRVFTLGSALRPFRGLRFDASYFNYKFTDLLVTQNPQTLINADPRGVGITRDAITDQITLIVLTNFNAARLQTQGFDLEGSYQTGLGNLGELTLNANASIRTRYKFQASSTSVPLDLLGGYNNTQPSNVYPAFRTKITAGVSWQYGPGSLTFTGYHYSPLRNDRATSTTAVDVKIPTYTFFDLSYSLDLGKLGLPTKNIVISGGLQNVFDKAPPVITYFNTLVAGVYDYRGRLLWVRASAKF